MNQATSGQLSTRRISLMAAALMTLTLVVYWPSMDGGFLWDDGAHITKPELRTSEGLLRIWTDPRATQQYYPLSHSAFWVMWWPFGEHTLGYHLVNVVLHVINAVLVWLILARLKLDHRAAILTAFVFALHPVNVESVAWITELKNTLSTLLYLLAMFVFLPAALSIDRKLHFARWLGCFALFLLALCSKSFTASWPAAVLVIIWWRRGRVEWRRDVLPLVPFFIAGVVMGAFTMWAERGIWGAEGDAFSIPVGDRFIIAGRAVWFYLATLVWPANLIFFYPRWTIDASSLAQWLWPASVIAVLAALWIWRHTIGRGPLAAALLFGGTLLPALGFFNLYWHLYTFVCDHMLYLPAISVIAIASVALVRLADFGPAAMRIVPFAVVLVLGALTWNRSHAFSDSITLWKDTIARNPQCWMAFNNLGIDHMRQQQPVQAVVAFRSAIEIKPDHAPAHANLARAHLAMNDPASAIRAAEDALQVRPQFVEPYLHIAEAYARLGRLDQCAHAARQAIALNPNVAMAYSWLALALQQTGDEQQALEAYDRALLLEPDAADVLNNCAWLLATASDPAVANGSRAVNLAQRALALQPRPETLGTLAAAYARAGEFERAVLTAQMAIDAATEARNLELAESTRERMAIYRAGRPWIQRGAR